MAVVASPIKKKGSQNGLNSLAVVRTKELTV